MSGPVQLRAERLHSRAVEAAARGHFAVASRLARRGLESADADSEVRARTLLTLAWAEAEQARVDVSLELLDEAELAAAAHPKIAGLTIGQRGVLLLRLGRPQEAREEIARAIPLLAQEPVDQARALLNKGVADLEAHDFTAARTSFERCGQIARSLGLAALGAKAESNLGQLTGLRGDLPAALGHFQLAMEQFGDEEPVLRAWTVVDSGFVLTTAGLLAEAESELLAAVQVLARAGVRLTEAEAWLSLAEIALVAERLADAQRYARRAERGFARRGSTSGALLARAVLAATAGPRGRLTAQHLADLRAVAVELDDGGFHEESTRLRLRAARRVARSGRYDQASGLLGEIASATRAQSLHTRLLARTVRAEVAQGTGDRAALTQEIRRGLADLQRHQSRLGSIDLQTSVVRHGSDLAGMGLRLAVASGRPAAVLTWLERTRALTTRIPPILPPDDQVMADLLGGLRHQRLELRQLELDRQATPESITVLRESCLRLERAAAARERQLIGSGDVIAEVTPAEVRSALTDSGAGQPAGVLISFFDVDADVHALVLTPDRAELVPLGPLAPVEAQIQRVRADLDVLALASTPAMMRTIVRTSLGSGLAKLEAALWRPVGLLAGDGPVSLIPTGRLTTLPWTMLPSLRGRPVTVARSPGEWLRGRQWPAPGNHHSGRAVFATGPRVDRAAEEIRSAAAAWPQAELLPLVTPMALLARVAGADLVHVAAHGTHDAENPLFSSLELTDGLLFGHDLARVRPAPRHVVLSACDLGLATARAGSESLGMTAALLHSGTTSVVSGVARVADDIACDVAVAYHARLSAGERPSYALAGALADTGADGSGESPAPLTCFGSGW